MHTSLFISDPFSRSALITPHPHLTGNAVKGAEHLSNPDRHFSILTFPEIFQTVFSFDQNVNIKSIGACCMRV